MLEEYGPTIIYIPGKKNIAADAMSRLTIPNSDNISEPVASNDASETVHLLGTEHCHSMQVMASFLGTSEATNTILHDSDYDHEMMADCFDQSKKKDITEFHPLDYQTTDCFQQQDEFIMQQLCSGHYSTTIFQCGGKNTIDLITKHGKIVVPQPLQRRLLEWYHSFLLHPGQERTEETIKQHFYWKVMRQHV